MKSKNNEYSIWILLFIGTSLIGIVSTWLLDLNSIPEAIFSFLILCLWVLVIAFAIIRMDVFNEKI